MKCELLREFRLIGKSGTRQFGVSPAGRAGIQLPMIGGRVLFLAALTVLGACANQPDPATTPTASTSASLASSSTAATPSLTPTPTPTQEALGPEGTAIAKDGKVWLVCKDGNYTIDVPEGYSPITLEKRDRPEAILQSSVVAGLNVQFAPRLDLQKMPTREKIESALASQLTLEWRIRDDLTKFADRPAVVTEFKQLDPSGEPDPNYDGTLLSVFTDIGDTRWVFDFNGNTREEAESQMAQIAATLKKQ
ncbi:hypothetical protein [Buchananella hordeovulneris]|uniref:hypothetical protein n=1 Tax=Buchananella hordeovulneris TaxID=52770 RepID=UPI000F5F85F2|nr:hypothetical protein [Buchananella hordeovulneris]RRD42689.1 hypothetical protein EII13_08805 [Buchananella hordeovulneris]